MKKNLLHAASPLAPHRVRSSASSSRFTPSAVLTLVANSHRAVRELGSWWDPNLLDRLHAPVTRYHE